MKSIKEKSEELSTAFRIEQGDVGYSEQLSYKLGIEAGANYVIEQLEEFLNVYGVYCITSSAKTYLKDMIEQLKGNQ